MDSIVQILRTNATVYAALKIVKQLDLNDCWIGAGFIRNRIWDYVHTIETPITDSDVDVIFYNKENTSKEYEESIENTLFTVSPDIPWSVKNQARMQLKYHHEYSTSFEAISYWPETATCIAARLDSENSLEIIAPYGCDDLVNLLLRPTPTINHSVFISRIHEKKWLSKWPKLKIVAVEE